MVFCKLCTGLHYWSVCNLHRPQAHSTYRPQAQVGLAEVWRIWEPPCLQYLGGTVCPLYTGDDPGENSHDSSHPV